MGYLNLTLVFEGSNLNYGEGIGNILALKKISSKGKNFSYISRQAIRYDIVRIMNEIYQDKAPLTEVNKEKKVIQFASEAQIDKYPEIDFFGYMKTEKKKEKKNKEINEEEEKEEKTKIRKAVVRLSDAVSLESYNNEMEFATNKGLADRIKGNVGNDIFQAEIHKSFYTYTITIELDKIGIDGEVVIKQEEKSNRINMLLEVVKILYRDIRGKRENLSPVFVIGGIYDAGNPFFYNRIGLTFLKEKILLNTPAINDILSLSVLGKEIKEMTKIGCLQGIFSNIEEIEVKERLSINEFFKKLTLEVIDYYKKQKV